MPEMRHKTTEFFGYIVEMRLYIVYTILRIVYTI